MFLIAKRAPTYTKAPSKQLEKRKKLAAGVSVRRRFVAGKQKSIQFTIGFDLCRQMGVAIGDKLNVFYGIEGDQGTYKIRKHEEGFPKFGLYCDGKLSRGIYNVVATYTFPLYMEGKKATHRSYDHCEYTMENGTLTVKIPETFMRASQTRKVDKPTVNDPFAIVAKTHNITPNMLSVMRTSQMGGHSIFASIPPKGRGNVLSALKEKGMITQDATPVITTKGMLAVQDVNKALATAANIDQQPKV